jgi:hypothetical protein
MSNINISIPPQCGCCCGAFKFRHNTAFAMFIPKYSPCLLKVCPSVLERVHFSSFTFVTSKRGCAMAQDVGPRPVTTAALFRFQGSPCGIHVGEGDSRVGLSASNLGCPLPVSLHSCSILNLYSRRIDAT